MSDPAHDTWQAIQRCKDVLDSIDEDSKAAGYVAAARPLLEEAYKDMGGDLE